MAELSTSDTGRMPSTQWILSGLSQTKIKLLQWLCPTNPACSTFWLSLEILPWKWKFWEAFIGQAQHDWFLWWAEVTRQKWKHLLCLISWDFCLLQLPRKGEIEREFLQPRQACRLSCKFNWPVALDLIQPLGPLEHSSQHVCVTFLPLPPLFTSFKSKAL